MWSIVYFLSIACLGEHSKAFDSTCTSETLTCGQTFYIQSHVDEQLSMQFRGNERDERG